MPAFGREEWVRDGHRGFTIHARVSHAVWPGGRALCYLLTVPEYKADMWLLRDGETGRFKELASYQFGMFRGLR